MASDLPSAGLSILPGSISIRFRKRSDSRQLMPGQSHLQCSGTAYTLQNLLCDTKDIRMLSDRRLYSESQLYVMEGRTLAVSSESSCVGPELTHLAVSDD